MKKGQSLTNAVCGFFGAVALIIGFAENNKVLNALGIGLLTATIVKSSIDVGKNKAKAELEKQLHQLSSSISKPLPTTRVFIDGSNLYGSLKHLDFKADYERLAKALAPQGGTLKYYFALSSNPTPGEISFIERLEDNGYEVIKSRQKRHADGSCKNKGDDCAMITDIALDVNPNDHLVIVSGDSDFAPGLKKVRETKAQGCRITVVSTADCLGKDLKDVADKVIDLKNIKSQIEHKSTHQGGKKLSVELPILLTDPRHPQYRVANA